MVFLYFTCLVLLFDELSLIRGHLWRKKKHTKISQLSTPLSFSFAPWFCFAVPFLVIFFRSGTCLFFVFLVYFVFIFLFLSFWAFWYPRVGHKGKGETVLLGLWETYEIEYVQYEDIWNRTLVSILHSPMVAEMLVCCTFVQLLHNRLTSK